jgi:NAD(P)-dependent dehydrogenase (short-subunit alcohol dehydrogenase family)
VRDYTGTLAYTRSKAANILFTRELQRRMDAAGFEGYSYSVHPGVVRTELTRYLAFSMSLLMVPFTPALWFFMKSPRQGAQTTLYAVLEDEGRLRKGGYFSDCGETESSPFTNVVENGEKLWRASEGLLGIEFNV